MEFPSPLVRGRLLRRYKRFFADISLDDGSEITAHCPNPGAMIGLNEPGLVCWLSRTDDPRRKLAYTWEIVEAPSHGGRFSTVGLNTMHPNRLVAEALAAGAIPEVAGYPRIRREVKYGIASRVDFLLEADDRPPAYLEVKNVHLRRAGTLAEFPDCVAARSLKHLKELEAEVAKGNRAVMLFVIQRTDCTAFEACADLDPKYAAGLIAAARAGVEVLCYDCDISPSGISIARRRPWLGAAA
ncbi:MAG TPA: DNA/RNA nuclease SfsA [Phenylobacterium sp.]